MMNHKIEDMAEVLVPGPILENARLDDAETSDDLYQRLYDTGFLEAGEAKCLFEWLAGQQANVSGAFQDWHDDLRIYWDDWQRQKHDDEKYYVDYDLLRWQCMTLAWENMVWWISEEASLAYSVVYELLHAEIYLSGDHFCNGQTWCDVLAAWRDPEEAELFAEAWALPEEIAQLMFKVMLRGVEDTLPGGYRTNDDIRKLAKLVKEIYNE
jgi:hypothetical protein